MNMNAQRRWIFAMALTLVMLVTLPALAQHQIRDGRRLDNNLQAGSGGYNPARQPNTAGAYQNALITGNVGGLARFRGDIDYLAPGEFTAGTAADDTYLFRLQSMPQSVYSRGATYNQGGVRGGHRPADQAYNNGQILQRSGGGITSGQITGQDYRFETPQVRRDDVATWTARSFTGLDQSIDAGALSRQPQTLGVTADTEGRLLQVDASPLVGITQRPLGRSGRADAMLDLPTQPTRQPAGETRTPGAVTDDQDATQRDAEDDEVETNAIDQMARGRVSALSLTPGLVIGRQINTAIDASVTAEGHAGRFRTEDIDELERRMFSPQGMAQVKPGKDVYMDLLRKIRGEDEDEVAAGPQPPEDQLTAAPTEDGEPVMTETQRIAEEFEKTRRQAVEDQAPENARRRKIEALLKKLDYNAEPLTTLAGKSDDAFSRQMVRAEKLMGEGKYFDAENAFTTAMNIQPADPMAQIGRINAQIGAGLYMTSSRNLRDLFTAHPELIAARYGGNLLPQGKRLLSIEDDLHDLLENNPQSDVPLLIAYMAYQKGNLEQVRHALDVLSTRRPGDSLIPLLRRIWIEGADAQKDKQPTP